MKKITFVSLISFGFLLLASFVTWVLEQFRFQNAFLLLATGIVIYLVSAAITFFSIKSRLAHIIALCISSVALGCCITAWYAFRSFHNSLPVMFFISLASITYLWIFYFVFKIPFIKRHFGIFFWIYLILSLVGYILVVALTTTTYVSTFGYYMIIEIAFIYTLCTDSVDMHEVLRETAISTFSVLVVAILIAVFMLSEGEGLDGIDSIEGITPSTPAGDKKIKRNTTPNA